jgi:signal transduction histidine kinase
MMKSLHGRLLIALMTTLFLGWMFWLGCQYLQMSRQQSGDWDRSLREVAAQILLFLPSNIETINKGPHLQLPNDFPAISGYRTDSKLDKMRYQAWVLDRRESVLVSAGAPSVPLRPDFKDGYARTAVDGEIWRVYALTDSSGKVQIQVGRTESQLHAVKLRLFRASLGTAGLVLLGLALSIWLVIRWSLRPVTRLQESISARAGMDLTPLSDVGLPNEIRPLVGSFNGLLGRLEQAVQGERQFLADAAHELRTPLAALLTQAHVAQRAGSFDEARPALEQLARGVERTSRLAQQLLDSARVEVPRHNQDQATVELAEVITMVTREFETMAARKQQTITLHAEVATVKGNLDDLGILVRNLVDNAIRYSEQGGRIKVSCASTPGTGTVTIVVADDGPGVPPDERERIFERFFRGSNGNGERGSGIGLSLVARIARVHGATLAVGTGIDGQGFGVTITFAASD